MSSSSTRLPTQLTNTSSTKKMRVTVSSPLLLEGEHFSNFLGEFDVQFSCHKSTVSSLEPVNKKHHLNFNISADTSNFYTLDGHWSNFVRNSSRAREIEIRSMVLQFLFGIFVIKRGEPLKQSTANIYTLCSLVESWDNISRNKGRARLVAPWRGYLSIQTENKTFVAAGGKLGTARECDDNPGEETQLPRAPQLPRVPQLPRLLQLRRVKRPETSKQVRRFLCFQNHRRQIKSKGNSNFSPTHYSKLT